MNYRKIDALVAEHIFGEPVYWPNGKKSHPWQNIYNKKRTDTIGIEVVPKYSLEISQAYMLTLQRDHYYTIHTAPNCNARVLLQYYVTDVEVEEVEVSADSAALAICLATLKAHSIDYEK